jgi:N-acetylmuramoyl-L-alanine amidase
MKPRHSGGARAGRDGFQTGAATRFERTAHGHTFRETAPARYNRTWSERPLRNSVNPPVKAKLNPAAVYLSILTLYALAALPCAGQGAAQPPVESAAPRAADASSAPAPSAGPFNRSIVVLDPAHGGVDSGSRIGDSTVEKDVTLALAFRLRSLLTARGFMVVMTRDSDNPVEPGPAGSPLTLDDRAGISNHARGLACLSLHATGSGQGVHLYSSELAPAPAETAILPWLTAQAAWVPQSRSLERRMGDALTRAGIPLVFSSASVRPVDSLTCPALVIEVAPQREDPRSINNAGYQQRIAQALAAALMFWRDEAQPPIRLAPVPGSLHRKTAAEAGSDPAASGKTGAQP